MLSFPTFFSREMPFFFGKISISIRRHTGLMPIVSDWSKVRLATWHDFEPIRDVHSYFSYL